MQFTVCTSSCRLSKCSNSYWRILWKFCSGNFDRATLFSTTSTTTIYLHHLDELHYVSTAAVTYCSNVLENQRSTYLRSTEQDVLFKQPQNSSPKRKSDSYSKRFKTSESLKCKLTSREKNQDTECQSEIYNKGMRPSWPAGFSITRKCASEMHCLAEKLKRDAKRQGERVLSDAHGLEW